MEDPLDIRHGNRILLFILEKGEIKKTDLLEVLSSSDSLSRSLQALQNFKLIEMQTKIIGRKVITIKLTDLGKEVAEQLKKADDILKYLNKTKNDWFHSIDNKSNDECEEKLEWGVVMEIEFKSIEVDKDYDVG